MVAVSLSRNHSLNIRHATLWRSGTQPAPDFLNASGDFVELDRFAAAIALDNEHRADVFEGFGLGPENDDAGGPGAVSRKSSILEKLAGEAGSQDRATFPAGG